MIAEAEEIAKTEREVNTCRKEYNGSVVAVL